MKSYLTDSLIICNPAVSDNPKFSAIAGSAIYILEHSAEGAVGVALNTNYSKSMSEIAEAVPAFSGINQNWLLIDKVFMGGPLFGNLPWILGRNPNSYEKTIKNGVLSLNFSADAFDQNNPAYFSICGLGSFGWGKGQLEKEMASFLWHHFPATQEVLDGLPFGDEFRGAAQILSTIKFG